MGFLSGFSKVGFIENYGLSIFLETLISRLKVPYTTMSFQRPGTSTQVIKTCLARYGVIPNQDWERRIYG